MINKNKDFDGSIFLSIRELSIYLNINEKTLYARVAAREIPCYKIGRLIRFKKEEIDAWMQEQKVRHAEITAKAKNIIRFVEKRPIDIDKVVRKSLDEVRCSAYSLTHGKPDLNIKGQTRKGDL